MSFYYTNQSVTINLTPDVSLSSPVDLRIYYRKPNGVTGHWVASINGGVVTYVTSAEDIVLPGTWQFKLYVDGTYSLPVYETFVNP